MVDFADIRLVAERIATAIDADRVVLFGSHASGNAREDSDVDLLIVARSTLPRHQRSRQLYRMFDPYPFSMDLIVYTPEEIARGLRSDLSFIANALREGKVIYERRS